MKFSKLVVLAVVALNVVFTAAVLYAAITDHTVPDSLIYSWFGFTGTELLLVAGIKKAKIKKGPVEGGNDA